MPDAVWISLVAAVLGFIGGITVAFIAGGMNRQLKVSEFRQEWIDALREDIAAYLGASQKWFHSYKESEQDWKLFTMGNAASVILYRIQMRINPLDNEYKEEDDAFLAAMEKLQNPERVDRLMAEQFWATAAEEAIFKARLLLKREWQVTKGLPIFTWPWS